MAWNYYDVLGVPRSSTIDEIKKAFKKAALKNHPDKGGNPEKFQELCTAAETLTDERKRTVYNEGLHRVRSRDGLRRSQGRDASPRVDDAARGTRPPPEPAGSAKKATASPVAVPVEIPSEPAKLSAKELKDLLTALRIDHEHALEKADLLTLLRERRERQDGAKEDTAANGLRGGRHAPASPSAEPAWGSQAAAPSLSETPPPQRQAGCTQGPTQDVRGNVIGSASATPGVEEPQRKPTTFGVVLEKTEKNMALGVDVEVVDNVALTIRRVNEGLVKSWNRENPDREIKEGDRVIRVNGRRGDVDALANVCTNHTILNMLIERR